MASLTFRHKPRILFPAPRSFSTSAPRSISLQWEKNDAEALADAIPPYPYPTRWYKQSRLGLYGGQRIQFGNNVGKKIEVKTRRSWHPNVVNKKLYSKALQRRVQVRVTVRVLRTIEKCGGLDEYLLGEKESRIRTLGESGWWLRWAITKTALIQSRFAQEREALGLQHPESLAQDEGSMINEDSSLGALEEASEEEVQQAMKDGESVSTDDAFTIETGPDLPPLKFRVGPGKHVVLTPNGWKRTRPHPLRWILMDKEKIAKKRNLEEKVKNRAAADLKHFRKELDLKIEQHNEDVTAAFLNTLATEPEPEELEKQDAEQLDESVNADAAPAEPVAATLPSQENQVSEPQLESASAEAELTSAAEAAEESIEEDPLEEEQILSKTSGYNQTITSYNQGRMLAEARKILEKTYRKAAHRSVDRAYEQHVVLRDTQTERRRLKKRPAAFSKNFSKEKAAMRKAVIAEHRQGA